MKPAKRTACGALKAGCLALAAMATFPANGELFTLSGGGLSGTANFTLGSNTVQIVLTNTTPSITSTAQLLSDVSFSISGGQAISTRTVVPTASLVTCVNGTGCGSFAGSANAWYYGMNGSVGGQGDLDGGTYILTALVGSHRSLILGSGTLDCTPHKCPDGLGSGPNRNNNQPYLQPSATFQLNIPGISPTSTISQVVLSFGTGPEAVIPIPAAAWLFGSGLAALIGVARIRVRPRKAFAPSFA